MGAQAPSHLAAQYAPQALPIAFDAADDERRLGSTRHATRLVRDVLEVE